MIFFRISRQIPEKSDAFCFFNQIYENKLESCRKFWNLWESFTITCIQNYSLVSLIAGSIAGCTAGFTLCTAGCTVAPARARDPHIFFSIRLGIIRSANQRNESRLEVVSDLISNVFH